MLRIWFTDFWMPDAEVPKKFKCFGQEFFDDYGFVLDKNNPDLLIYSWDGQKHRNYNCKKLFFMPENARKTYNMNDRFRQDFNDLLKSKDYDFLIVNNTIEDGFFDKEKVLEYQSYFTRWGWKKANQKLFARKIKKDPPKDICMVYSSGLPERYLFAKIIKERFKNSAGLYGPFVNNPIENIIKPKDGDGLAGWHCLEARIEIASQYKFEVAIENSRAPGHVTEKLHEAYISGCIPIYCGARNLERIGINSKAVIYCNDLSSESINEVLDKISEICADNKKFDSIRSEPLYLKGCDPHLRWKEFFKMVHSSISVELKEG
jgi:hypothetical protein